MQSSCSLECRYHLRLLYLCQCLTVCALIGVVYQVHQPTNQRSTPDDEIRRSKRETYTTYGRGRRRHPGNEWMQIYTYANKDEVLNMCASLTDMCSGSKMTPGSRTIVGEGNGNGMEDGNGTMVATSNTSSMYTTMNALVLIATTTVSAVYNSCLLPNPYCPHDSPPDSTADGSYEEMGTAIGGDVGGKKKHRRKKPKGRLNTKRCFVTSIGQPILRGKFVNTYGSWMRDAHRLSYQEDTAYVTQHMQGHALTVYNETMKGESIDTRSVSATVELDKMFEGTTHVVFNNKFIYQEAGKPRILMVDLASGNVIANVHVASARYRGDTYLYERTGHRSSNTYMHVAVDEMGLWVIYRPEAKAYLRVLLLDTDTLRIKRKTTLRSLKARRVGHSFIVCGVLYVIDDAAEREATIRYAYDLHTARRIKVDMAWSNPYSFTTSVNYNPIDRRLYVYDNGALLSRKVTLATP